MRLKSRHESVRGNHMKLGIIGLPQSGKTTIYNALTRSNQPVVISGKIELHTAVVEVPDPRVDRLVNMFHPRKTTPARVTYVDISGLEGSGLGQISGQLRNELGAMDGFIQVVRCFEDDSVPHAAGKIDPATDITRMESELLLNDLITVEGKLERLTQERSKGGGRAKAEVDADIELFQRLQAALSEEQSLRALELDEKEEKAISGYLFLSRKPMLVALNLGEGEPTPDVSAVTEYSRVVPLQGSLEMEIAQLPPEEAGEFLREYGIQEPSLYRMIRESYDLLGLQSFFTVGEDEVRAWTVRRGAPAVEAAGVIHSDLQKGFIRAEVVPYEVLSELGSMAAAREAGKLQLEGRGYVLHDGEIMHVRFNI
jgi:GTP-binding protein YchF